MTIPTIAECFAAAILLVTGLSHVLHPRLWAQLFRDLFARPYAGLWMGTLTLLFGLPILFAHNAWTRDPRVIATVIGWGWSFKGTLYLLAPALPLKVAGPHIERPAHFAWAGAVGVVLGALLVVGIVRS